jgi:hypothetical protein
MSKQLELFRESRKNQRALPHPFRWKKSSLIILRYYLDLYR